MKGYLSIIAALFTALTTSSARADEVSLDTLIVEVKRAIFAVQQDLHEKSMPPLQSVTLTLATEVKKTAGGGFDIWILDFSKKYDRDSAAQITVTLKPPKAGGAGQVGQDDIANTLKTAIETTVTAVQKAQNNGPPALGLDSLKATLKFGVTNDTGGGLKFTIAPVTINATGDYNASATQQIDVTYGTASDHG